MNGILLASGKVPNTEGKMRASFGKVILHHHGDIWYRMDDIWEHQSND